MPKLITFEKVVMINTMTLLLIRWRDGVAVCAFAIVVVGLVRSWAQQKPEGLVLGLTAGAALWGGMQAAHTLHRRLQLQAEEGLLAVEALSTRARVGYFLALHGVIAVCLAGLAACVAVRLAPIAPVVYAGGAGLGHVAAQWLFPALGALWARGNEWRRTQTSLAQPRTAAATLQKGLWAAAALSAALLAGRLFLEADQRWLAGLCAFPLVLLLLRSDEQLIRFQALSGHGVLGSVGMQLRPLLSFAGAGVAAAIALGGTGAAALTGLACVVGALWAALQVMVSRVYQKPVSDGALLLSGLLIGGSAMISPLLPPLAAILVLWRWHGLAQPRAYLIA